MTSRWVSFARAIWIVLAVGYLAMWLVSVPGYYTRVTTLTIEPFRLGERLIYDNARALNEANQRGLSLQANAIFTIGLSAIQITLYYLVSAVIFVRATDRLSFFTAFILLLFSTNNMQRQIALAHPFPGSFYIMEFPTYIIWPLWSFWLGVFPTGQVVPRWARYPFTSLIFAFGALQMVGFLSIAGVFSPQLEAALASTWRIVIALPMFGFILVSQIYRYLRVSTSIERQQTKWFLFGLTAFFVDIILFALFPSIFGTSALLQSFSSIAFLLFPISVALAVLRYRLWDIDIIIRRTLIYSILTALLALFYFGSIVVLQQVFRPLIGAESDLAIIISTLAIAVLFNPLRHRVQDTIDHRFYRRKYDAHQVLERFAQTARDEVELEKLTGGLLNVVNETIQPTSVSLWLKPARARRKS